MLSLPSPRRKPGQNPELSTRIPPSLHLRFYPRAVLASVFTLILANLRDTRSGNHTSLGAKTSIAPWAGDRPQKHTAGLREGWKKESLLCCKTCSCWWVCPRVYAGEPFSSSSSPRCRTEAMGFHHLQQEHEHLWERLAKGISASPTLLERLRAGCLQGEGTVACQGQGQCPGGTSCLASGGLISWRGCPDAPKGSFFFNTGRQTTSFSFNLPLDRSS